MVHHQDFYKARYRIKEEKLILEEKRNGLGGKNIGKDI